MKKLLSILIALVLLLSFSLVTAVPAGANGIPATIEVSQPTQLTTSDYHDRNPSFFEDSSGNWWVFFGRGTTSPAPADPDNDFYNLVYLKSTDSGATWTEGTLPALTPSNGGTHGAFSPAAFEDSGETIWVFYAANLVDIYYFTSTDGGSNWSGPTATEITTLTSSKIGNHLDAFQAQDGKIWVFFWGTDGVFASYYSGGTWSNPANITASPGWTPHVIQDAGGDIHVIYIGDDPLGVYIATSTDNGVNWSNSLVINTANDDYDPVLVKDATTWRIIFAPYISADDHQWLMTMSSPDLTAWSNPVRVTAGYGVNEWWDCWPEAANVSSIVLFYTSMKDGSARGDMNICMYNPMDWDLSHNHFEAIQPAIDSANPAGGDTISVAAGEYAGAVVDKSVTVSGAPDGASVITSGVPYKVGKTNLHTAFRPDADGAEISNFTINCDVENDLDLGVYAVLVDGVTVDSLTINGGTMQGISNWGGSDWVITNNVITETVTSGGGGIGIFVGAKTQQQCVGNLIQYNTIHATATAETYSCAGIALCLDERSNYNGDNFVDGSEDVSGNQILDNTITSSGANNGVGIEVGTILGNSETDPDRTDAEGIAALMEAAAVKNNLIQGNSIDGAETGVYFYNVTDLTVTQNEIVNSTENGIYVEHGHSGVAVNYNNIYGNTYGLEHEDIIDVDYGSIDATKNWWGHASGPGHALSNGKWVGKGNKVSDNVDYKPWLHKSKEKIVPTKKPAYAQSVDLDNTGEYGWNTFSAPIFLDDEADTWAELYALTDLDYSVAYRFDSDNQTFVPLLAADDYAVKPGEGFFIKMDDIGSLSILYSTEENLVPPSRALTEGWNLIGLANLEEMDVDDALASIAEAPGLAGYSQVVSPIGNVNPGAVLADGTIYVGESYWVYMLGERTLAGFTMTPVEWVP